MGMTSVTPSVTLSQIPAIIGPGDATRDILIATPPGYDPTGSRRYPVLWFQDGQNLFDPETSFAGHWQLLETLGTEGLVHPAIVVGIPNLGPERLHEYSPFDDFNHGPGEADSHLNWLITSVKPLIDQQFLTLPARRNNVIVGSSMGGLFALWAVVAGAATFGGGWAMSPALWYADRALISWLRHHPAPVGRIRLDVGLLEGDEALEDARLARDLLIARGWSLGSTLQYAEDPAGAHDEASWGRRLKESWAELVGMAS
jgi:predicted alpha/beta superfamily hydrolase